MDNDFGLEKRLLELSDEKYRNFQRRLIPTVAPETIIGVRTPALRALAREFAKTPQADAFMAALPHRYFEENNIHGFLIDRISDYDQTVRALDAFLPYVDNWATCDLMSPKAFKKRPERLEGQLVRYMESGKAYTVRFGIEMLMSLYLDEAFDTKYLDLVAGITSDEYYVNMMRAWFFATALAKQYDAAVGFIARRSLDTWTHNKTIQKAVESYRISDDQKAQLRSMRIK